MQQQDRSVQIKKSAEAAVPASAGPGRGQEKEEAQARTRPNRFDWPALVAALAIAVFFALTARFNSQPSPSYIPAAVFSATGCGLLVTAIRKLRRLPGAGLLEAGFSGFGMALFQFAMTFTYPGVFGTITSVAEYGLAFLITWSLVALFAVILSLAGATIGHLAFSPLRPLPARAPAVRAEDEAEDEAEPLEHSDAEEQEESVLAGEVEGEEKSGQVEETDEMEEDEEEERVPVAVQSQRSLLNYMITVLLLGLLPMMAGYVFAATYDFILNTINVNAISPALYPTLSLLSGLLPWRLAVPINLTSANGAFIVFTLLWRIPDSVLGNPNLFDVQALEGMVFAATGLALLLITKYKGDVSAEQSQPAPLNVFLFLEALLGLIAILPANLWLLRGLEGILQFHTVLAQLPTVQLLDPLLFTLNLLTGILFCVVIGLIVRRQYQLWTMPRRGVQTVSEERSEDVQE